MTAAERLARAWHWLTTSRYTRWLEAEVERLRAENETLRHFVTSPLRAVAEWHDGRAAHGQTDASACNPVLPDSTPRPIRRVPWAVMRQRLEIEDARKAYEERKKGNGQE